MDKSSLRSFYITYRNHIPLTEWQHHCQQLCKHILDFCMQRREIQRIFLFHARDREFPAQTLTPYLEKSFQLGLPVIYGKGLMHFHEWKLDKTLSTNRFQIQEPSRTELLLKANAQTLILVPNLALDKHGNRLGYGGGYYDRYLSEHPEALTLSVHMSECIVDSLPRDTWDQRMQWIGSEQGLWKTTTEQKL